MSLDYSIPDEIANLMDVSGCYQNFTASGNCTSYGIDLSLPELNLSKSLKARDLDLLPGKIEATAKIWHKQYLRHLELQHKQSRSEEVEELNQQVTLNLAALDAILTHTLSIDDAVNWGSLKQTGELIASQRDLFVSAVIPDHISFSKSGYPESFSEAKYAPEPVLEDIKSKYGLLSQVFQRNKIQVEFDKAHSDWLDSRKTIDKENNLREQLFKTARTTYDKLQSGFTTTLEQRNRAVEKFKVRYDEGNSGAIEEYCDLVLSNSKYPDYFPKSWVLEYRKESRILLIDYDIPSPNVLSTTLLFTYVKTRDVINEKKMTVSEHKRLYDRVIYQICIRTFHELFEADISDHIDVIVFNGLVTGTNEATGIVETKTIISISANKDEFVTFDLENVDPKATFRHLKGVAAANLSGLTPVPPVMQLEKTDKRFIEGRGIVHDIDERTNLAAMHWEDFEHLVRELFEKEFASSGSEVRVTQASSDGGVDAIAFDSDPIRGGKIVIQAKRYTNTVGVAAVRDLYGTVVNEGAIKGILITTSDYGKDSHEFAKGKPLTLLSGGNMLAILEKHGHHAKIDVAEAKKLLAE